MTRTIRFQFLSILVVTVLAAVIVCPFPGKQRLPLLSGVGIRPGMDLAGGAELRYQMLFDSGFPGSRATATELASEVIRRRVEPGLPGECKVTTQGDDGLVVQLPGVSADGLDEAKRRLRGTGDLRLYASASAELRERYDRTSVAPDGTIVVRDRDGAAYLVEAEPVVEGRHVIDAEPILEPGQGGVHWVTSFQLDHEGARRFDEAAARLYDRRPRGRIVIVLDGQVRSAPVVESPAFHGRGRITLSRD